MIQQKTGGGDIKGELDVRLALDAELRKEDWTLRRQAAELDEKIASYRETLAGKEKGGERSTTTARNDAALQLLQDQLLKLELEGVHLAENYAPGSPSIVDNQRKIEVTRNAIATQQKGSLAHRTVSTSPARLGIESELEQALAQRRGIAGRQVVLDGQLARSRESLSELDVQALQATRLQRLIAVTADRYATYLKSGEAARIDSALDAGRFSNVIVVQDAAASSRPVKPKKLITLLVSVLGGVLAGLGTCAWLELKRTGFERVFGSLMAGPVGAS